MATSGIPPWQASNAVRTYPFDERATLRDDSGIRMPDWLCTDTRLWWWSDTQHRAFISSVLVTDLLISITILQTDGSVPTGAPSDDPPVGPTQPDRPLATLTLLRDELVVGRAYPIDPVADGAGGWMSFGPIRENLNLKFSSHIQSLIGADAAAAAPSPTLSRIYPDAGISLRNVPTVRAGPGIVLDRRSISIDGISRQCLVISIDDEMSDEALRELLGPCLGHPAGNTCGRFPIYSINGVEPDENGNIMIEVQGATLVPIDGGGGAVLQSSIGLDDICNDPQINSEGAVDLVLIDPCAPSPAPSFVPDPSGSSGSSGAAPSLIVPPYLETFDFGTAADFIVDSGAWDVEECVYRTIGAVRHVTHVPIAGRTRTISCWAMPLTGSPPNAHILFGGINASNFWYAGMETGRITIGNVSAGQKQVLQQLARTLPEAMEYELTVATTLISTQSNITRIVLTVFDGVDNHMLTLFTRLLGDGHLGLFVENGETLFDNMAVDWTDSVPQAGPCSYY